MPNHYDLGDQVRCTGTFTNSAGGAVDPGSVFFQHRPPGGTISTYQYGVDGELAQSGTGIYYVDLDLDTAGLWHYRWYSTGTGKAAGETYMVVQGSEFV